MSIFDQLGKAVSNVGAQAAPEQGRPAYLERLEQSKAAATVRLSGMFATLGKAYYESHADDHGTEYEAQLASIRDVAAEIAGFDLQAEEIVARKRCPACGAQLPEGSRFCNACGTKLLESPSGTEQPAPEQAACPRCNAPIGPDDAFCLACGADLRDAAANGGA